MELRKFQIFDPIPNLPSHLGLVRAKHRCVALNGILSKGVEDAALDEARIRRLLLLI